MVRCRKSGSGNCGRSASVGTPKPRRKAYAAAALAAKVARFVGRDWRPMARTSKKLAFFTSQSMYAGLSRWRAVSAALQHARGHREAPAVGRVALKIFQTPGISPRG